MNFLDFVKQEKLKTDKALKLTLDRFVAESSKLDTDYGDFTQEIAAITLRGGKRLRSLLVRLGHDLVATEKPDFDLLTASLYSELLHIFILIHDDIADRDLKRYGGPSLEVVFKNKFKERFGTENDHFGLTMALIAGDLLHTLGDGVMIDAKLPDSIKIQVMRQMQHTLHQVIAGWHIHFWQNHMPVSEVKIEKYLKGMELVSASYTVQGPLELGLILAQEQEKYSKKLKQFGYHVGLGFQIQDDILGIFGDTEQTGKPTGNDIREGKKTLLVLKAYEKANKAEKKFLEKSLGDSEITSITLDKVREVIKLTGSLDYSNTQAQEHIQKAITILDSLEKVNAEPKNRLHQLAEFVIKRNY